MKYYHWKKWVSGGGYGLYQENPRFLLAYINNNKEFHFESFVRARNQKEFIDYLNQGGEIEDR